MSVHAVRNQASRVPLWARIVGGGAALALVLLAFNATRETAVAASFSVNSTADAVDASPGTGGCATAAGECTLRAAIQEANASGGPDTITLPAGTYTLTIGGAGEDTGTTGDLDITDDLTIIGAGADVTIVDAGFLDRAIEVHPGAVNVAIQRLTVVDGFLTGGLDHGAAILHSGGALTIEHSRFSNNIASGGLAGGGAVASNPGSSITIRNSTFQSNSAASGGGAVYLNGPISRIESSTFISNSSDTGGAIHSNSADATIENSTFHQNTAVNGGAVDNRVGVMTITNSTLVANSATGAGDSIQNQNAQGGITTVGNSILSGATVDNCSGTVGDGGNNITWPSLANCPGLNTDPQLALSPTDNGGPTVTFALPPGSPAVDGAGAACGVATDQRGQRRPVKSSTGGGPALCDVGAYELGFVVNTGGNQDDGTPGDSYCDNGIDGLACTFKAAIQEANGSPGLDYISFSTQFNDPGGGGHLTVIGPPIDTITDPVVIDGYAGFAETENTHSTAFNIAQLPQLLQNDFSIAGPALTLGPGSQGSVIRGLQIDGFQVGISVQSNDNVLEGNWIGGFSGAGLVPNVGVSVFGTANLIGGPEPGDRNLIAGVTGPGNGVGVDVNNAAFDTVVRNNLIGTDRTGTIAAANTRGVVVTGALRTTVTGNVVSGNTGNAIRVCSAGGGCGGGQLDMSAVVSDNLVGLNAAGTGLLSNGGNGESAIYFDDVANSMIRGNKLAGSATFGMIDLQNNNLGILVENNTIGLAANGSAVLPTSAFAGIYVDSTTGSIIRGNTIAGMSGDGIQLFDGATGNTVSGNTIGANAGQNAVLGNSGNGIRIDISTDNQVSGNLIVGSGGDGIRVSNSTGNVIDNGNLIGALPGSSFTAAPNANGIRLTGFSCANEVGSASGGNTIAGNTGWGIVIEPMSCPGSDVTLLNNKIGVIPLVTPTPLANGAGGVLVDGAEGVTIGGAPENLISGNAGPGIRVQGASARVNILANQIYANDGFLGIDLVDAGDLPGDFRTANDPTDNDTGPNSLQNTPVITGVTLGEGSLTVAGTLPGGSGVTTYHFYATDQFLPGAACSTANPASSVGQRYLGSDTSNGDTFSILLTPASLGDNEYVTATATGATGTSEFSPCFVVGAGGGAGLTASIFADAAVVQAGASVVPISDIPLAALSDLPDAVQGVPISAIDIDSSPISAIPISAIPISAITVNGTPISAIPISAIPISAIPISAISTWEGVLAGSALAGVPLQSITLEQVLADPVAGPRIQDAPISAIELFSTSLRNVSITSVLLGSTPISAIANTNTWLCPPETSLCGNGATLMAAEIGGLPISAIPISAIPISAIPISAIPLAGTPISAIQLNSSPISAIDLNSIPISAIPISAIPISAIPISAIPISAIPISAIGVGGAPISAIPISAITTPTGQSFCDYAASLNEPCGNATTVAQFVAIHGAGSQTLATTPISAIPISAIQALPNFADSLAWLIGFDSVGELYDNGGHLGTMTVGQMVVMVLEAQNYPWEELPLDKVDLQAELATSPVLNYTVEHMLATGTNYAASISVTLPRGFLYKKGSATVDAVTVPDPVIAGSVLNFNVAGLTAGVTHELSFDAFSSLSTGSAFAIATVSAEGENVTTVSGTVVVTEAFEPANNQPTGGPFVESDNLYLSHIGSADDVDYYQVPSVAAGSRIGVYLSQLGVDMDLVMYTGNQLPINSTSLTDRATAPQTLPVADQGAGVVREDQFIEPQTLQDIAIQSLPIKATSALRGTADETIESVALRDNEGPYFVAVRSYNRAVTDAPYVLRVRVTPPPPVEVCPAPAFPFPNDVAQVALDGYDAADANTVIVVNRERLAKTYGQAETDSLITKLNEFANATALDVRAKMVDVSGVDYSAFDGNRCDPVAANGVVTAISAQTLAAVGTSGAVKHLVIVGGDEMVPMARIPDLTRISNERDYRLDLVDLKGGAFGAAASGHYLSDDPYGDFDPIPWLERFLYVPDVGIGRLVETPDDIEFALNAFIASGGALNPQSATTTVNPGPDSYSVSGYDFLADGATEVDQVLAGQAWTTGSFFTLISELWDAPALLGLLAAGRSVNSINAHFDHFRLLPADQDEAGLSEELVTTAEVETLLLNTSFAGKLIFSMGCHSGLNISDLLGNSTNAGRTVDWAQTFVGHGAVLIGNTGYGYGDTESVALSERLMALFAKRMDGSITAAQALTFAKQDYYSTLGLYGVYDEKALMQVTYYGLPMYRVHEGAVPPAIPTPAELPAAPTPDGGISGTSSAQVTVSPESTRVDTSAGSYWTADPSTYTQGTASVTIDEVGTQVTHYQPIQPRLSFDVTDHANGLVAHGALITSLGTDGADVGVNPVYARPVVDSSDEVEISSGDAVFPARLQAISSYNAPDGPRQNLVLVTGQFLPDGDPATDAGAQRLYSTIGAKVYYSSSNDFFAPDILRAEGTINGGSVTFTVETRDRDAAGLPSGTVRLVNVLFRDADCATGCGNFAFQSLNLTHTGNGVWTATVAANGAERFEFLVQAVDGAGNVGVSTSKGVLFLTVTLPPAAVILAGPSDPTTSTAASFSFGTVTPPLSPVGFECSLDGGAFTPCQSPAFYAGLGNGSHTFSVRAVNAAGAGAEADFAWTIAATAPGVTIDPVGGSPVGSTITVTGSASAQPSGAAINKIEYSVDGGAFQAGPTIVQGTSTTFAIPFTSPAAPKLQEVCVRARDVRGTLSTPTCVLIAWFDVAAGFATGDLTLPSPAGAYVADEDLEGTALLNLNTKYKKNGTVPEGATTFSFLAAGLEFTSTSYDWLVISGNLVQLRASGTINGTGNYQILVTARDNGNSSPKTDAVRIRIVDASGGSIIYDNQPGAPETAEPAILITGGNLVVHN